MHYIGFLSMVVVHTIDSHNHYFYFSGISNPIPQTLQTSPLATLLSSLQTYTAAPWDLLSSSIPHHLQLHPSLPQNFPAILNSIPQAHISSILLPKSSPFSSANLYSSAIGSAPGDRTNTRGVKLLESL